MTKNKGKGGKNRRRGKNDTQGERRELQLKDDEQEYGQVLKMLGNARCDVFCFDGVKRLAHIRGKMRKKVWVNAGDIVLISQRDFQDEKCDVIHKYNADEARSLKAKGHIPLDLKINEHEEIFDLSDDNDIDFKDTLDLETVGHLFIFLDIIPV